MKTKTTITHIANAPIYCEHCAAGALRIRRHGVLQHLANISGAPAWWDCNSPQGSPDGETPQAEKEAQP